MGGSATIRIGEVGGLLYPGITDLFFDGATVSQDGRVVTITITGGGGGVPSSRTISTSAPLAGGGDLSTDRTLSLSYGSGLALSGSSLIVDTSTIATRAFATAEAAAAYAAAVAASQPLDADLTALAALGNGLPYRSGGTWGAYALGDLTVSGGSVEVTQARGLRETAGPTTLAMGAVADGRLLARNGTTLGGVSVSTGLTLAAGALSVDTTTIATLAAVAAAYQPLDSDLTALAALSSTGLIARTGAGTVAARTLTAGTGVTITNPAGIAGDPLIEFSGGTNEDFSAAKGRLFWVQPNGAGILAEGTAISYGAGAPTDGSTTTEPIADFTASGTGTGKTFLTTANVRIGYGGTASVRFSVNGTSNCRYFIALTSTATTATPPPVHCVGLVFDPGLSSNWRMVGTNTPSSNVTYKDLGVAPVAGNIYRVEITTTTTTATLTLYDLTAAASYSATIDTALGEYLPGTSTNLLLHLAAISISVVSPKTISFRGAQYRAQYSP